MQIIKRDGHVADFDPDKIYQAIIKAARTVYVIDDTWRQNLTHVTKKVVIDLEEAHVERPTINMVQSLVENRLMDAGYITIAEHYISYRLQRDLERNGYGDKIVVHLRFEQINKNASNGILVSLRG
ncbi:ATP-binding protein [Streptococcus pyogenes]|nr:ATP-binding protein [Streptococcus pyogenes]